jgi:hypothetical protein
MFDTSVNLIIPVIIIVSCYMCIVITMRRREQNVLFSEKSRIDEREYFISFFLFSVSLYFLTADIITE